MGTVSSNLKGRRHLTLSWRGRTIPKSSFRSSHNEVFNTLLDTRTDIATYEHRTHLRLDCHWRGIRRDPRHGLVGHLPQTHLQHPFAQLLLCGSLAALHA